MESKGSRTRSRTVDGDAAYVVAAKDLPVPDELLRRLPPHSCLSRAPASQVAAWLGSDWLETAAALA